MAKAAPWKEQCGTEFYNKYSSQSESWPWLLIMESEDLIPLFASLHSLKIFILPTKIKIAKIMVQDFIRYLLGQFFFSSCILSMVLAMSKHCQLLIAENERKSKSKLVPQGFTETFLNNLYTAFTIRSVSALRAGLFLLITDFYMHPVSLFSIEHNLQAGLSNYPTYIAL